MSFCFLFILYTVPYYVLVLLLLVLQYIVTTMYRWSSNPNESRHVQKVRLNYFSWYHNMPFESSPSYDQTNVLLILNYHLQNPSKISIEIIFLVHSFFFFYLHPSVSFHIPNLIIWIKPFSCRLIWP